MTKARENRKGHDATTPSLVIGLLSALVKLRACKASNRAFPHGLGERDSQSMCSGHESRAGAVCAEPPVTGHPQRRAARRLHRTPRR
jgi:hypothetical protein